MAQVVKYGKIEFSDQDIEFIKENFQSMTNQQIADALGLKKTTVRTKAYDLGLQRMQMEYWSRSAIDYLVSNYKTMGNVEIVEYFKANFPKEKGWTTKHITKKLSQLGLKRNRQDWYNILERNRQQGSYGKPNPKKKVKLLKAIVTFKEKKYLLSEGQSKEDLFNLILSNQVEPIEI